MLLSSLAQDPFAISPIGSISPVNPVNGNNPPSKMNGYGLNAEQMDAYGTVTTVVKLTNATSAYRYELVFRDAFNDDRVMNLQEVNEWIATQGMQLFANIKGNQGEFGKYIAKYQGFLGANGNGGNRRNPRQTANQAAIANPRRDRRHNVNPSEFIGSNATTTNVANHFTPGNTGINPGPSDKAYLESYVDHCIAVDYLKDRFKIFGGIITKHEKRPHEAETTTTNPVVTCVNRGLSQTFDYWSIPKQRLETMNTCFFILKLVKIKPDVTKFQSNMTLNSNNMTGTVVRKTDVFNKPYMSWQYVPYHCRDEVPPISVLRCKLHPELILPYIRIGKARENIHSARSSRVLIAQRNSPKCVAKDVSYLVNGSLPIELYININQ